MNILTFDLEDWFHILDVPGMSSPVKWESMESRVERNTDRLLDLLSEMKITATFFCLGWIAKKYPTLVKKVTVHHEIGCHSMIHKLLFEQSPGEMSNDLGDNIKLLEDLSGQKINSYRAPGFSFTPHTKWLVEVLANSGIEYDCSVFPMKRNHGGYDGLPAEAPCKIKYRDHLVKEFPMNIASLLGKKIIFSGGGYFRLLPYNVIASLMNKSPYVMTYFHPRDFDNQQPMLEGLSLKRKFMSYVGLKHSYSKLNRLLNDYKFVTIGEAAKNIDWNAVPAFDLENY